MAEVPGRQVLGGAVIVGIAVIVASLVLAQSLNRVTRQLDQTAGRLDDIRSAVVDAKDALGNLRVAAPAQAPRTGADPDRRYTVKIDGAPAIGPATAAVTIVEFSDFQ